MYFFYIKRVCFCISNKCKALHYYPCVNFSVFDNVLGQTTVTTAVGATVTLPCSINKPQWTGPVPSGTSPVLYNIEGSTSFVESKLGSKAARVSWANNQGDLILSNVIKKEDEGNYTCSSSDPIIVKILWLVVRGNMYL